MRTIIFFALSFTLASAVSAAGTDANNRISAALISELNTWLDAETEYKGRDSQPRIELITTELAEAMHGVADRSSGRTRGLYDAKAEAIYLTEPWNPDNLRDVSILLHEMVHHRQAGQHWYCDQAQEWRAYQIQAQWLAERQIKDDFYWPAILLQSSCAKRDIHPQ